MEARHSRSAGGGNWRRTCHPRASLLFLAGGSYKTITESLGFDGMAISATADLSIHHFMGEVRWRIPRPNGVTPFVHALFGAARLGGDVSAEAFEEQGTSFSVETTVDETRAAFTAGGGIDVGLTDRFGVRAGANYIRIFDDEDGRNALQFAAGVVLVFLTKRRCQLMKREHVNNVTAGCAFALASILASAVPSAAQEPADARAPAGTEGGTAASTASISPFCFRARSAAQCRFFAVTALGVSIGRRPGVNAPEGGDFFVIPGDRQAHATARTTGDFGLMWNVRASDAVGMSWFVTIDDIARTGPAARYRRWLTEQRSLEIAVGVPVAVEEGYGDMRVGTGGTILGLVSYNALPWLGVVVRPEMVRLRHGYDCSTSPCIGVTKSYSRVLVGVEFREKPGAIAATAVWGLVGLFSLAD